MNLILFNLPLSYFSQICLHRIWETLYSEWYWQKITHRFHRTLRRIHPCKDLDHIFLKTYHTHFQQSFDIGILWIENKVGFIWLVSISLFWNKDCTKFWGFKACRGFKAWKITTNNFRVIQAFRWFWLENLFSIFTDLYIPLQESPKNPSLHVPHFPEITLHTFPARLLRHWHTMDRKWTWSYLTCLNFTLN